MGPRPTHLNLNNDSSGAPQPPRMNFHLDLPSPRAGEVPPALSPLDAIAMHSRMLAKRFEEEEQNGRRISRLPALTVAKELANRPDYFRSISGGSESAMSDVPEMQEETSPTSRAGLMVSGGGDRPMSHYPMLGNMSRANNDRAVGTPFFDAQESHQASEPTDYFAFGAPRAASPEPVDPKFNVEAPSPKVPSLTSSIDSITSSHPRTLTNGSTRSQRSERGLLPPRSPGVSKSPRSPYSMQLVRQDSAEDDGSSYNGAASSRKFSGSSTMSRPQSPFSPPMHRTSSNTSEYSINGSRVPQPLPRAPFMNNFSRPMSSSGQSLRGVDGRPSFESRPSFEGRPSLELAHRHPSDATNSTRPSFSTNTSRQNSSDDVHNPDTDAAGDPNPAPSYIYTKYSLPRGRTVERNSIGPRSSWMLHQFTWENPIAQSEPEAQVEEVEEPALTSIPRPREDSNSSFHSMPARPEPRPREDSNASFHSFPARPDSPKGFVKISGARLSRREAIDSMNASRSHSVNPVSRFEKPVALHRASPSVQTESTDRTIRATPLHERSLSSELTPDEHLEIGIQAHSSGQLSKSTYHLRLAANAGLPTAMLLYALACRHGWGMRANQEDGVMWLRKAIDGSGLEMMDIDQTVSAGTRNEPNRDPVAEAAEKKKRKAQFALATYELGTSYMNGWGCPKDKALALRCYEVAGNWGDPDALAEAAFCYAQGSGCRKDLKKAAALYGRAADLGISMAGNSWIYKPKYMDDTGSQAPEKESKKQRNDPNDSEKKPGRSRGKSIWNRKKEKS